MISANAVVFADGIAMAGDTRSTSRETRDREHGVPTVKAAPPLPRVHDLRDAFGSRGEQLALAVDEALRRAAEQRREPTS